MRAIICDDDEIILRGLCSVLDWEKLGVEIVGTAGDGKTGLQLLKELKPDLLLTDIRMPYVDGLDLIQYGKTIKPDMMVIVFSGFDDFAYVRRALRLGVQDYLTKPIDIEELTRLVAGCSGQFFAAKKESFEERENLLRNLLVYEDYKEEGLRELERDCCQVILLEIERESPAIGELADSLRGQNVYVLTRKERRCELAVIAETRLQVMQRSKRCVEMARQRFEQLGIGLVSAVSGVGESVRQLARCQEEAETVWKLKYVKGYNQHLSYQELKPALQEKSSWSQGEQSPLISDSAGLVGAVKSGNAESLDCAMNKLEEHLKEMGLDSYLYMQFMVGNLYSSILKELDQIGICTELVFEHPMDEYRKLIACETVWRAVEILRGNLRRICEYVGAQKGGAYSKPICRALQYIRENYMSPSMNQEEAASEAGLSSSRFSTLFKNETGSTFTDYLLKVRMERAQELIRNPNMKIYEIAQQVGYENIPYFSTAFRKYTGLSPSEYRENRGESKTCHRRVL